MSKELQRLESLQRKLTAARTVKATLETEGWVKVGQLVLDKYIIDSIGGKVGNQWKAGLLSKPESTEKREYMIGYKQALIDFHNRLWSYVEAIPALEQQIKDIEDSSRDKQEFKSPMSEGPYVHDGGGNAA